MVNSPHTQIQTHTHTHTWTLTLPKMISSRCCTRAYLKWPNFVPAVFSLSSGMCLPVADCLPIKAAVPPRPQHSVIKTQDMDSDHGVLPLPVATWFLPVNFLIYAHIPVCLAACHLYACQPLFPRQSLLVLTVDRRRWGIWLTESEASRERWGVITDKERRESTSCSFRHEAKCTNTWQVFGKYK